MAVTVTLLWQDFVLDVIVLRGSRPFVLGERRGDYPIPRAVLGARRVCVLTFDHGTPCVTVSPAVAADGKVETRRLQPGESVRTDIGSLTLLVARLASSDRISRAAPRLDVRLAGFAAIVAALQLSLVGWAAYALPPTAEVTQRVRFEPLEVGFELKSDGSALAEQSEAATTRRDPNRRQNSREGLIAPQPDRLRKRMGVPNEAARAHRRFAIQGPADNPDPHVARREGDFDIWLTSIGWDCLRDGNRFAPIHPSGRDDSLGTDDFSVRAPNLSGQPDASHGDLKDMPTSVIGHLHKTMKLVDVQPLSENAS